MDTKRIDGVLTWDDFFMGVAKLASQRSKDPSTQVGSCIVNSNNIIVGVGYNGFPRFLSKNADDILPWNKRGHDNKYLYVCHAEMNAICNKNTASLEGCRIFVTLFPCNECTKLIIQTGISEVIYNIDKYRETPASIASRRMLDLAGISYRQLD